MLFSFPQANCSYEKQLSKMILWFTLEVTSLSRKKDKILVEERRKLILKWLHEADGPLTGSTLAHKTNVSRQVIVQDISLLKAKSHPIIATSQGYILMKTEEKQLVRRKIVCSHPPDPDLTKDELYTMVDHGAKVIDVTVEHPLYGDLTGSLLLQNRKDVDNFIKGFEEKKATLLSELTDGIHLHTIEASNETMIEEVKKALLQKGYLVT